VSFTRHSLTYFDHRIADHYSFPSNLAAVLGPTPPPYKDENTEYWKQETLEFKEPSAAPAKELPGINRRAA
jgi:hypothetical protein